MIRFCKLLLLIAGLSFASVPAARAQENTASVASPDGEIEVRIWSEDGVPTYDVRFGDDEIVRPSRLGLRFLDGMDLDRGLAVSTTRTSSVDTSWDQPWGERRVVADQHNELAVDFAGDDRDGFTLRVRVFDTGVGFRYEVPGDGDHPERRLIDEVTRFNFAAIETAWWIPAAGWNRYEYLYEETGPDRIQLAHTPFTLRLESGTYVALHEAALVDYSGMWLKQLRPGDFEADLAPTAEGYKVLTKGAFVTPWRTIQIGETAVDLINSDIILNLNAPPADDVDYSWAKPSKYIGIWWCMHINQCTWGSGDIHGATTERTKRYIDFAAEHGFDGVLVEGWNIGWDGEWFFNGDVFSFTEAYPDFDIEALAAYAAEKGVYLIGHHETSGNTVNYEAQLAAALDLYERLGIPAIKTGYVADGGDLVVTTASGRQGYGWHDGQEAVIHRLMVIREAAKRKIVINEHEPVKDTGLRRTYPNMMSREGARGQEYNAWGVPPNDPAHTTILPFTRMLSGPMDFTPGIFDLTFGKDVSEDPRVQTTLAKQLALYVVIYSPIQMAADLPENYEARPDAFNFIKQVPIDWEETIAVDGEIGEFIVFARKDRHSPDWYIGAITDEEARTVSVPLGFLDQDGNWTAEIYRDGEDADWRDNPYAFEVESRTVTSGDTLDLKLAPGGGTAIRLTPAGGVSTGELRKIEGFETPGLRPRDVRIWLPPGYDGSGKTHYPVLYMHDGQNLFEPGFSYGGVEWGVDEVMGRLIEDDRIRPAIVVGISNTEDRWREYVPAEMISRLPEDLRDQIDSATGGGPLSDDYLAFLTGTLKPFIDAEYPTLTGPEDTLLAGSSMGGLITLYGLAEYPDVFGAGAAVSTHWVLFSPELASPETILPAILGFLDDSDLDPDTQRIWFDHGTENLDSFYGPYQDAVDAWFTASSFEDGVSVVSTVYPGADHNETSWNARLDEILIFLLGRSGDASESVSSIPN